MYKTVRTDTLWTATEAAPAVTTLGSGSHIWFLTDNTLSGASSNPPSLSIHKITLDDSFERAVLEACFKIKAVGTQTACTACIVRGVSALLYGKAATGLAFFDDSLISQLQGSALSPADVANGEAAMVLSAAPAAVAYGLPFIFSNNAMGTDWANSAPVIWQAGGRTPAVNDVTKFFAVIGGRRGGAQSASAQGAIGIVPDISGVRALHLGLKWIPTWTNGLTPSTSIAGKILLHLQRKVDRNIG